jgi:hypothetical protein
MKRSLLLPALALFLICLAVEPAAAQFPTTPDQTLFVCNATGVQNGIHAFADNGDGYYAYWIDKRDGNGGTAIYAQYLDTAGRPLWGANGKEIYRTAGKEIWKMAAIPWREGVLVAWIQGPYGSGGDTLFCNYYDRDGAAVWQSPTLVSSKDPGASIIYVGTDFLNIFPNDSGATVAFGLSFLGGSVGFSMNRVDASGNLRWPVNDFKYNAHGYYYSLCSDNYGGIYLASTTGGIGAHIYVQHFDLQRNALFPAEEVDVSQSAGGRNVTWMILCDADTNAYVVWDNNSPGDIVVAKVNPSGKLAWPSQYRTICAAPGVQSYEHAILHNNHLYVIWSDPRPSAANYYLYMQKLDTAGNSEWTPDGVQVSNFNSYIPYPRVAPAGDNVVAAYQVSPGLYAQQLRPDSSTVWPANGIPIHNGINLPFYGDFELATAPDGTVAAFWATNGGDICAAKIRQASVSGDVEETERTTGAVVFNADAGTVSLALPDHSKNAGLSIVDLEGREIFNRQNIDAGTTSVVLNIRSWSRGAYFVRMVTGGEVLLHTMLIR